MYNSLPFYFILSIIFNNCLFSYQITVELFNDDLLFMPKRYGLSEEIAEMCPDRSLPQQSREGNIIWCQNDEECQYSFKCTPISGFKHFGTQIKYCCATRSSACSLPPQPGYGECNRNPRKMYYFDSTALQCLPFKVLECQGINGNRFESISDCRSRCETTACEAGESPLFENNDIDKPKLCHEEDTSCPQGYTCRYDKLFRRHICCGYKNQGACAADQKPFMVPFTGRPKSCSENSIKDECPPDFVCATNPLTGYRYCCSPKGGVCPAGQHPYIHPLTDKTIKCNPISYSGGDCPVDFSCSATVTGSQWGFCCSNSITASCPKGTSPFTNPISQQPQKCTIGVTVCHSGYLCQNADPLAIVGFCCTELNPPKAIVTQGDPTVSLYSLTEPRKTYPIAPVLARPSDPYFIEQWRPEIRLVDIQRRIDRSDFIKKHSSKSRKPSNNYFHSKSTLNTNLLRCPSSMAPVLYLGTSLPLKCEMEGNSKCPPPSECVEAFEDPLQRSLCCVDSDDDDSDELLEGTSVRRSTYITVPPMAYSRTTKTTSATTTEPSVNVLTSSDPFCPSVIEDRICTPGSTDICIEDSFFCQFNIQFQKFMCCSLNLN